MEKLPHECGVALVCLPGNDADAVPGALAMLRDQRHRGRQGAGLAVPDAAGGFSVLKFDGDNSLGFGYMTGTYYTYKPIDNCYVWQSTKTRHYFGPTKAEVSLVWLIGCGNYNKKKGGVD